MYIFHEQLLMLHTAYKKMPLRKRSKSSPLKEIVRPLYEPIISPYNSIVFEPEITVVSSIGQHLHWLIVIISSFPKRLFNFIQKCSYQRTTSLLLYITSGIFIFLTSLYLWKQYLFYDLLFRLLVSGVKLVMLYL